jgi:hypothetical protein
VYTINSVSLRAIKVNEHRLPFLGFAPCCYRLAAVVFAASLAVLKFFQVTAPTLRFGSLIAVFGDELVDVHFTMFKPRDAGLKLSGKGWLCRECEPATRVVFADCRVGVDCGMHR